MATQDMDEDILDTTCWSLNRASNGGMIVSTRWSGLSTRTTTCGLQRMVYKWNNRIGSSSLGINALLI